jgi:peptidoglycan/xylan/chitin deacetylase (PgdA/CDA1 family)
MIGEAHSRARRSATQLVCGLGINRLFERRFSGVGSILAFHRVGEPDRSDSYFSDHATVRPQHFRRLIEMLIRRGYDIVSMTEAAQRLRGHGDPARKFVCLTFDDGYKDNHDYAFPICASLGVTMVVNVTTGFIRRTDPMWWLGLEQIVADHDVLEVKANSGIQRLPAGTPEEKRKAYAHATEFLRTAPRERRQQVCEELGSAYGLSFLELTDRLALTPKMMREMHDSGLVEFGAHTRSHANLLLLPAQHAREEVAGSRRDLEELLGSEVRHFAFPYGRPDDAGPRELALCRELGFETAVTTRMGNLFPAHKDWMHALPRLTIRGDDQDLSAAEVLLSGAFPALRHRFRAVVTI